MAFQRSKIGLVVYSIGILLPIPVVLMSELLERAGMRLGGGMGWVLLAAAAVSMIGLVIAQLKPLYVVILVLAAALLIPMVCILIGMWLIASGGLEGIQ